MKKLGIILLALTLLLTACGKQDSTPTQQEKLPVDQAASSRIRYAISLLADRQYIVNEIGQGGQEPAGSFVARGLTDADGSPFYKNGRVYLDPSQEAYSENFSQAIEILEQYYHYDETSGKFTDFPTLTFLYNTDENHRAVGEYLQSVLASVGIPVQLENQEWNTFLNTRKNGDYTIARNGWVADYNDPLCFLEMWTSDSGNNDVGLGKGAHSTYAGYSLDLTPWGYGIQVQTGTWSQTYDVLIDTIRSCPDRQTRYALLHLAQDMVMDTGCIMPLYYYTDLYLMDPRVEGFYGSPLGFKYFQSTRFEGSSTLNVCLASEPESLDPALNATVDGATTLCHLFSGLARWGENGELLPDCAQELPSGTENPDGTVTYTYTLREGLKWSDGKPLTAADFVFSWNRAASDALGADYGYLYRVITGYGQGPLGVEALDDRTLQVTLTGPVDYWNELLAFPALFPVREDTVGSEGWATDPGTYIGNGPYVMTGWEHDARITMQANPYFHDPERVTMENLHFYLSDDSNNMLVNFKNGTWQFLDQVASGELPALKKSYASSLHTAPQLGTYYLCWNINRSLAPGS